MGPYFVLGDKVMIYRIKARLTQKELAERTGMTQADISRIEWGKCNITIKTLIKIAEAMGKDVEINFVDPNRERT